MAKKYVNGYDAPRFIVVSPDGTKTEYDLSGRYQMLMEYYQEVVTLDRYTDGSKTQITHFYEYEWELIFGNYMEKEDRLKIAQVEAALKRGEQVLLVPHIDYNFRFFDVLIKSGQKALGINPHHGGLESTTNTEYSITFMNKWQMTDVALADPDYLPLIAAISEEEF